MPRSRSRCASLLALGALATAACEGAIGDAPRGPRGRDPSHGGAGACAAGAGTAPLRRLTQTEYDRTVRDLLGVTTSPAQDFVADDTVRGFRSNAISPVTALVEDQYMRAAEELALAARARLGSLLPCDPATAGEDACARSFVRTFGRRAYRRPLSPVEMERLVAIYTRARADGGDFAEGIRRLVSAMLQSPWFLYHVELGVPGAAADDGRVPLTGYEVASRLAYFLWATLPDDELLDAAAGDSLATPAAVEAQAERMLDDPRAREGLGALYLQWLGVESTDLLSKDPAVAPEFTPALGALMREETRAFFDHVLFEGDGRLTTLLTASFSFLNEPLASIYGVEGVTGDALRRVDLDPAERGGFLTHASILATQAHPDQTSPVHRGRFVRQRLLCQTPPPPPPTLNVSVPEFDPSISTRARYERHTSDPTCQGCHQLMDPIGFGFESYDTLGRFRTTEGDGVPIDSSGELLATDVDGPFHGAVELGRILATSAQVTACVAEHATTYAIGRALGAEDACALEGIVARFAASGGDLRVLLVAIAGSDTFRRRAAIVDGECL